MSLQEDNDAPERFGKALSTSIRIYRAAEALLHCANLYRSLGLDAGAQVELGVRCGGLKDRVMADQVELFGRWPIENRFEDGVDIPPVTFGLAAVETDIVGLVKRICEPLFVVFDFTTVSDSTYSRIVTAFVEGRVGGGH